MTAIDPLVLPEILISISRHLNQFDIVICLRVCKAWHELLLPIIWNKVQVVGRMASRDPKGPTIEDLLRRCEWVRNLDINHDHFGRLTTVYPKLHTLKLKPISVRNISMALRDYMTLEDDPLGLITYNPTLVNLSLERLEGYLAIPFWKSVSRLSQLTSLHIQFTVLSNKDDIDTFWNACSKLQSLCLVKTGIPVSRSVLDKLVFTKMQLLQLDLVDRQDFMEQINLVRHCPNLEELLWCVAFTADALDIFGQDVTQGLWPKLERLDLGHSNPDEESSRVLGGLRRITKLNMTCTEFGPLCYRVLQTHFNTLTELCLYKCPRATSVMLHEVMCSSPHLKELHGNYIKAKDIIDQRLWVCHSLKRLRVCIVFDKTEHNLQPRVFERLSTLTRLEDLSLGDWADGVVGSSQRALDFRLESGLERLSRLKNMRRINVYFSDQSLEVNDIQWMIKNWPHLEALGGKLNRDTRICNSLLSLLQAHRIKCNKIQPLN